ncbi:MAG TPA: hypothetical protein VGP08_07060 [Pyrinomonadaceae bacterium]|jgi:hypothetical protein|nr:hypothetical protein [Pyrinomonadaceae bacterium]
MPVVKKRNQQTESRLLLESDEPVELPPAEVEESAVVLQFEQFRQYVPELLEELRDGTLAEPVPVMMDGATFVVHGDTRSFWVKLWHSSPEQTRIERVQIISCLPSTRGVQILVEDPEALSAEFDEDDDFDEDGEYDDDVDDEEDADDADDDDAASAADAEGAAIDGARDVDDDRSV